MVYENVLPVTMEEFEPYLGRTFNVQNTDVAVELKLVEIEDSTKGRPWPRDLPKPFLMIFSGPPERILLEGLRVLHLPGGPTFQLYVIPILTHDPSSTGQQYQVVIN